MTRGGLFAVIAAVTLITGHGASTAAELTDFFQPPQAFAAILSPDGNHAAVAEQSGEHASVVVTRLSDYSSDTVFDAGTFTGTDRSYIETISWLDNSHIAVVITEDRAAIAELLDTEARTTVYIVRLQDSAQADDRTVYKIKARGNIVHSLPDEAGVFVFSKAGFPSNLYRIQIDRLNRIDAKLSRSTLIDGGQFSHSNKIISFDGFVFRWFFDDSGAVQSVFAVRRDGQVQLATLGSSEEWEPLKSWDNLETFAEADDRILPIANGNNSGEYYIVASAEGQSDGLYLEQVKSGERELVFRHPTADIFSVTRSARTGDISSIGLLDRGEIRFEYTNDDLSDIAANLRGQVPGQNVRLIDNSGSRYLLSTFSSNQPPTFHVWDTESDTLSKIADAMPWLNGEELAVSERGEVESHDLQISYYLTMPTSGDGPLPLILLPHGGPIGVADTNTFDPVTQLFASAGYAVLQVNYRGSAGFNDEFLEAGKHEWGGKILDDILAAHSDVVRRPEIDADRSCAVGSSYGGYAAMMMAIQHPHLFRCAVSIAGVSDVMLWASNPNVSSRTQEWIAEFIGDPITDREMLREISPTELAHLSEVPMLIVHGRKDDVVDIEHAARMSYHLEKHGKAFRLTLHEEIGHSFSTPEEADTVFSDVLEFLQEHLDLEGEVAALRTE